MEINEKLPNEKKIKGYLFRASYSKGISRPSSVFWQRLQSKQRVAKLYTVVEEREGFRHMLTGGCRCVKAVN